jgi:protein-S-isoprenylcysteine O-methyltransferase Ste14
MIKELLTLIIPILFSLAVCFVLLQMTFSYTAKRANQKYGTGKSQAPSVSSFTTLSKILFMSNMAIALVSFWWRPSLLAYWHQSTTLQLIGIGILFIGYVNLRSAFTALGENYSPLFDAYHPHSIQTQGIYKFIRHPIYLFNLFVSYGLAISSGSLWALAFATTGLCFVLRAISLEEQYLPEKFPEYKDYAKKSWRLIPYIF